MNKLAQELKENSIQIALLLVVIIFFFYIFNEAFRLYLISKNIDANFIIGFLTTLALLMSLIQSSYDKKFNYNMRLIESIENKGMSIIAKLLLIKNKSEIILGTLQRHKDAIINRQIYQDTNDILSSKDINEGGELIGAYINTYFNEETLEWNDIVGKLSVIATNNANIVINYNKNIDLIKTGLSFKNTSLDKIDEFIENAEKINKEIERQTQEMRDRIVTKINENTKKIRSSFAFKI